MEIDGLATIVTGGASGLGGATAARLARAGARVTIFDRDAALGERHAAAIGGAFMAVDVTDEVAVAAALETAEAAHGIARILVNCAGIGPPGKVIGREGKAIPLADFAKIVSINLIGSFAVLARFAERLQASAPIGEERGVIVNTASVAAYDGQIGQAAYAASKGGIVSLTLPVAREFARFGIRVMTIAPGLFLTPALTALSEPVLASLGRQVPFPARLGHPDEFAQMVEEIVRNPMLNGETIRLDGAIRMGPQ